MTDRQTVLLQHILCIHRMHHTKVKLTTSELRCHTQYTGTFKTTGLFLLKVNSIFNVYSTCKTGT